MLIRADFIIKTAFWLIQYILRTYRHNLKQGMGTNSKIVVCHFLDQI